MKPQHSPINLPATITQFMAVTTAGASVLRNQGQGVAMAIQVGLTSISLDDLRTLDAEGYENWLDERTIEILDGPVQSALDAINAKHRPWGTVRKGLNLFMRACICDHYLRRHFDLDRIEPWAEMPLDSVVAFTLKRLAKDQNRKLPDWPGLKHLTPEESREYQTFAGEHTETLHLPARIYLDYELWLRNRMAPSPS